MAQAIRVAINGASGRMGQALLALLRNDHRFELVSALVHDASRHLGEAVYPDTPDSLRYVTAWPGVDSIDVVVDFSGPNGLASAIDHCVAHRIPLVTGTTGVDAALEGRLHAAAHDIALMHAANFSLGVAVMTQLLREAAAALPDWDLEIVESHHGRKEDAPSGTALALGAAAAQARGTALEKEAVYARQGRPGTRVAGNIGFAVVRGGDIVGEHLALLLGHGERVELAHRATDRSIFARGALETAQWLQGRGAGIYSIDDMLCDRRSTKR
jgi:4-hydroxy-tetrahydrodipicolinate reductase